mmetsp:Transcript_5240/g.15523  ORF Transcript_5240/g.15523 Transcript_5240/m.15523 type:complete len:578 (+) Transcript_5240:123-1856(+)
MKIELEALPMLVGFGVGTMFFLIHRLFDSRLPQQVPREKKEKAEEEEDSDEVWLAARGLSVNDVPVGAPQDPDAISIKAAAFEKEAPKTPVQREPMAEPGPEPGPEPAPERAVLSPQAAAPGAAQRVPASGIRAARPAATSTWHDVRAPLLAFMALLALKGLLTLQQTRAVAEDSTESVMKPIILPLTRQSTPATTIGGATRSSYCGTLYVGTPPKPFTVLLDMGSGHLILPSASCGSEVCRARRRYHGEASNTSKSINHDGSEVESSDMRDHITISFETGEVSGVLVEDHVCMRQPTRDGERRGAVDLQPAWCMSMRMIAALEMSKDPFKDFTFDGVLGLGLLGLSEGAAFNFLAVAAEAVGSAANRYSLTFALFLPDGSAEGEDPEFTLGGYNSERLEGDLAWNEVVEPHLGQWMLEIKSLRVGDEDVEFCARGCRAIMDTGTSGLVVPSGVAAELLKLLRHPSGNGVDCSGLGPKLHFGMDGITLTLEPEDYVRPEVGSGEDGLAPTEPTCKAMLMSMDIPEPVGPKLFIMGEPVLRKYYTVYDAQVPPRIGLAPVRRSRRAWEERAKQLGLRS